jgi:hypothetical protein
MNVSGATRLHKPEVPILRADVAFFWRKSPESGPPTRSPSADSYMKTP